MNKEDMFKKELDYIKDEKIKESAKTMVNLLPDYFFKIPASSTGKYHPMYATGDAGLVRHTKAAVRIAVELFGIYKLDDETKDLMIASLILHDGLKKGIEEERYTRFDHPLIIGDYLKGNKDKLSLNDEQIERMVKMLASHMGKWNTNEYNPDIILPVPKTMEEKFVHMCDYLASRKSLELKFDQNNDVIY